jgi:hypothetical protein
MRNIRTETCIPILVAVFSVVQADFCPNLRTDAVLDQFIYRIATRYHVAPPASFFSQPMTVCDALRFIDKADSLNNRGMLSLQENEDLRQIRLRISAAAGLLTWHDERKDTRVDVRCVLLDTNSASFNASFGRANAGFVRGQASPALNANLGNVSFYSTVDVWTDYRSDSVYKRSSYQPYDGISYNLYGRADSSNFRSSDILRGGLVYDVPSVRLEAGIDRLRQGPSVFSPLTFSGNAPPMTFVRGMVPFGIMDYTQAFGMLQSENDKPKYFYMHRISVPFFSSRLVAGLSEVVTNGSTTNQQTDSTDPKNQLRPAYYGKTRGWELAYMIPFVPYAFTEHFLGDRDNKALSFDLNLAFPDDFRWYFELFIDDMTAPWTLFSHDWGNKWAIDIGGQYFTRVFSRDMVASLEYCRVEPWVYTHFYGGSHRYDNFNVPLGAPLGPNSDLLVLSCESRLFLRHWLGVTFSQERTNHSYRGGNITDVFQDTSSQNPDSPVKEFLSAKGRRTGTRCGLVWRYDRFGKFRVNFGYEYDFSGKSILRLYGGLYF